MELRGKIALEAHSVITAAFGELFAVDHHHTEVDEAAAQIADAILSIPEIRDALAKPKTTLRVLNDDGVTWRDEPTVY